MTKIDVPDDEIEKVTDHLYTRRIHEMFTHIDNYSVQETRREAKAEERVAIAKKLLEIGVSVVQVCAATGLSREEVEKLRNAN